ncbi:MAG: CapA family protein [Ornithinimicrobium sp.]
MKHWRVRRAAIPAAPRHTPAVALGVLAALSMTACASAEGVGPADAQGPSLEARLGGSDSDDQTAAVPETPDPSATTAPDPPVEDVTLAVVGDMMFDRKVESAIDARGQDAVMADVRDHLRAADFTVGNLETPLGTGGERAGKRFAFLSDPASADILLDGGFDLVTLANNHILDYGVTAMNSTERILDEAGIAHVGVGADETAAHEPVIVEIEGQRIAFLGYFQLAAVNSDIDYTTWIAGPQTPGVAWAYPQVVADDVAQAREEADHVIVLLHSGRELGSTELTDDQQAAGNAALAAGATAVLGHHPHVLQGWQSFDDQFVAWSLGNFVFDFPNGTPQSDTAILNLTLDGDGVKDVSWTPVRIVDTFPQILDPAGAGQSVMQTLEDLRIGPQE